jgi:hypothetical protein
VRGCTLWLLAAGWVGCAFGGTPAVRPDTSAGVEVASAEAVVDFYERANAFYDRMARRRFNSLATYQDEILRQYFRNEASFSDYYADLADSLDEHHFEKNRPVSLEVQEFLVDGPGRARVRVRLVGRNALPLRIRNVVIDREDRWERVDGHWWVVPGKL